MRIQVPPVEHGIAAIVAVFLADLPAQLIQGSHAAQSVACALADSIPWGVGLALVARTRRPFLWALLASVIAHAVATPWYAIADEEGRTIHEILARYRYDYADWAGPLVVLGTAVGFYGATRLKGTLLVGIAFGLPDCAGFALHSWSKGHSPSYLVPFLVGITVFLPLVERIVVAAFAKLGIRDSALPENDAGRLERSEEPGNVTHGGPPLPRSHEGKDGADERLREEHG